MALAGNVETIGLASVFKFISTYSLSGLFRVTSENGELSFCFTDGRIFFPRHRKRTRYTLGGMLRKTGVITREIVKQQDKDDQLEQFLRNSGTDEDALLNAKRMQFEEEIYDLFMWNRAFFEFKPGEEPKHLLSAIQRNDGYFFNTDNIVLEAAKRSDDLSRIKYTIPSLKNIFQVTPGREGEIDKQLAEAGIDGTHKSFDGRVSIQTILDDWKAPYTLVLAVVARLIENKSLVTLDIPVALDRFRQSMEKQDIEQALADLQYLLHNEKDGPNRLNVGLEGQLIKNAYFAASAQELRFDATVPGSRVFKILKFYMAQNRPFSIILRENEHEKLIVRSGYHVAISSTRKNATPKLIHFLQRANSITEQEARKLWKVSGKELYGQLLGTGRVTKDQWLDALAEKVCEELSEVFFWRKPQIEIINRAIKDESSVRSMKITLPLNAVAGGKIVTRLKEFAAMIGIVPSEDTIFARRHADLPAPHPFYKHFDGVRPLTDIRQHARAGPIEFFRFVYNGVKKRVLRAVTLEEFISGSEEALNNGNQRKAIRFMKALRAFELENLVPDLVKRIAKETRGVVLEDSDHRLEGDLIHFSLAEVFQTLTQENLSGTLSMSADSQEINIYFLRGKGHLLEIEEESSESDDFLGVFGSGEDDASDFFSSFGEMGSEEEELSAYREEILNVFFWKEARFEFRRGDLPDEFWEAETNPKVKKVFLGSNAFLLVLLNKLRRLDDIRQLIPNEHVLLEFVSTAKKMEAMASGLFPEVVMLIDGQKTIDQLARVTSETRFDLYDFLYNLVSEGALKVNAPPDYAKVWEES